MSTMKEYIQKKLKGNVKNQTEQNPSPTINNRRISAMAQKQLTEEQKKQQVIDFVKFIIHHLDVEEVTPEFKSTGRGDRIDVYVPVEDRGKVIGRNGRNISSIHTLTVAVCAQLGIRAEFHLIDN